MKEFAEVLVYFNRNVNPFLFLLNNFKTVASDCPGQHATEYFYQLLDNSQSTAEVVLKKLSVQECKTIIGDQVSRTVRAFLPPGSHLVVGVSGGGDSNALLHGLSQLREYGLTVHPTMLKGIPDWDQGISRAQELCRRYDLELKIIKEQDIKELIGVARNSPSLIDRFEREFKGDDFEFLGTLLIRLALTKRAQDISTRFICTGLNLEDIVCENMFRLATGLKPSSSPLRVIGDISLILPLWLCPKRIIDGCFPDFSRENYEARYPCFSLGRNFYYSVVYALQSQFPGFLEQLAQGWSELSSKDPVIYTFNEQLGFHVERFVPLQLLHKFRRMLDIPETEQIRPGNPS
jgi:tRNA(Ile)-lysidine synthase TilS/MesJ